MATKPIPAVFQNSDFPQNLEFRFVFVLIDSSLLKRPEKFVTPRPRIQGPSDGHLFVKFWSANFPPSCGTHFWNENFSKT